MEICYSTSAHRALRRSGKGKLIRQKIEQLAADPRSLEANVKRLQGRSDCRLRVQDWRVIFRVENGVLYVDEIGPRGAVY